MTHENFVKFEECIAEIHDPRVVGRAVHPLRNIIAIALSAAVGGVNDFVAVEKFGWDHCDVLEQLLGLKTNIPSYVTFNLNRFNSFMRHFD